MGNTLNEKQRKACRELIKGCTQEEACVRAGYAKTQNTKAYASRLFARADAKAYLDELRKPVETEARDVLKDHLEELASLRDAARQAAQFGPAITAETNRGKAQGLYTEKTELSGPGGGAVQVKATLEIVKVNRAGS